MLPPCIPVINSCNNLQKWMIQKENWPTKAGNPKVVMLEVNLDTNVNAVSEQTADQRKADAATVEAALGVQPEHLHDINKESCSQGKLHQ